MSNLRKFSLRGKNFFFTYPQNETSKEIVLENIKSLFGDNLSYCLVCEEDHHDTDGKHLHVLIQAKRRIAFSGRAGLKKLDELAGKHGDYKPRRGTEVEAARYLIKDGNFCTYGFEPTFEEWLAAKDKKRNPKSLIIADALRNGSTLREVKDLDPGFYMMNQRKIIEFYHSIKLDEVMDEIKGDFVDFQMNEAQKAIMNRVESQTDREITWVVDTEGNKGKTYLAKYLHSQNPDKVCYFQNIRTQDATYNYNGQDLVIFDFTREQHERVNYSIIESLKNGIVFSAKYEPILKHYKPPKILCYSNWYPDETKLSNDRWDIINLDFY